MTASSTSAYYPIYNYGPPQSFVQTPSLTDDTSSETSDLINFEPYSIRDSGIALYYPMDLSTPSIVQNDSTRPSDVETEDYLRRTIGISRSRRVDLWSLPDCSAGTKKPAVTDMARLAIWGSSEKRLTLSQIFDAIEERYPEWKNSKNRAWQRSIRHNLSLKAIFEQVSRPRGHPGKGNYWVLNVLHGEANKRPQQKKKKRSEPQSSKSRSSLGPTSPSYNASSLQDRVHVPYYYGPIPYTVPNILAGTVPGTEALARGNLFNMGQPGNASQPAEYFVDPSTTQGTRSSLMRFKASSVEKLDPYFDQGGSPSTRRRRRNAESFAEEEAETTVRREMPNFKRQRIA